MTAAGGVLQEAVYALAIPAYGVIHTLDGGTWKMDPSISAIQDLCRMKPAGGMW